MHLIVFTMLIGAGIARLAWDGIAGPKVLDEDLIRPAAWARMGVSSRSLRTKEPVEEMDPEVA